jgi:hypothetical protein
MDFWGQPSGEILSRKMKMKIKFKKPFSPRRRRDTEENKRQVGFSFKPKMNFNSVPLWWKFFGFKLEINEGIKR